MRIVTGLQDTQYFEPETAMDWAEEDAPNASTASAIARACASLTAGLASSSLASSVLDESGRSVDDGAPMKLASMFNAGLSLGVSSGLPSGLSPSLSSGLSPSLSSGLSSGLSLGLARGIAPGVITPSDSDLPAASPVSRSDFHAALALALASTTGGIGWIPASIFTDENGGIANVDHVPMSFVTSNDASPVPIGFDESGSVVYAQPDGQWLEFSVDAFTASFALSSAVNSVAQAATAWLQTPALAANEAGPTHVPLLPETPMQSAVGMPGHMSLPVAPDRDIGVSAPALAAAVATAAATAAAAAAAAVAGAGAGAMRVVIPAATDVPKPVAATAPAVVVPLPSIPAASTTKREPAYVGETPVEPAWLDHRRTALLAVRADYVAARTQAQSTPGAIGWGPADTFRDDDNHVVSGDGGAMVFIPDPNAQPELIGYDENVNPVYKPVGQFIEFFESAFVENYQAHAAARTDGPLQALAALYGTDASHVLELHPDVWGLVISDHAIKAGFAPAGKAMGEPALLGMLDLYMADPLIASLINGYGTPPPAATGDIAVEQVRLYGVDRFTQLGRLANAMQSLRDQFDAAFKQARDGGGVGWIEVRRMSSMPQENGSFEWQQVMTWEENGPRTPVIDRVFDAKTFSVWYESQPGLANQACAQLFGLADCSKDLSESGQTVTSGYWFASEGDGSVRAIELNRPPGMFNNEAIGFDPLLGWVTPLENFKDDDNDLFQQAFPVLFLIAMACVMGPAANAMAAGMGLGATGAGGAVTLTLGGTMVSGAIVGAGTAFASGVMNGGVNLKNIVKGMLSGALTAGLADSIKGAPLTVGEALVVRSTAQGGIQMLLGGKFEAGALSGFATGLAALASDALQKGIDDAVAAGTMSSIDATSARVVARMIASAINAAGHPENPLYSFANSLLTGLVPAQGETEAVKPPPLVHDGDGALTPAPAAPTADGSAGADPTPATTPSHDPTPSQPSPENGGGDDDDRVEGGGGNQPIVGGPPAPPSQPGQAVDRGSNAPIGPGTGNSIPPVAAAGGFTRNNGEHVDIVQGTITGALRADPTAPVVPEALLPGGITSARLSARLDDAGTRWYVVDTTGQALGANLFTGAAQRIVDQGPAGLESGAITPSQYLESVRFINANGLGLQGPVAFVTLPPVTITMSPGARQSVLLQDQALQMEMVRFNIQPIDGLADTDGPLTKAQADLLTQTGRLLKTGDAQRAAGLRDSGQLLSLATVGATIPISFGSLTTAAAELGAAFDAAAGSAAVTAGRILVVTAENIAAVAAIIGTTGLAGVALLVVPGNVGQGQPVDLPNGQRFVTRPGDLHGNVEERDADGNWHVVKSDAVLMTIGTRQVVAVNDDELRRLTRPSVTPGTPLPPPAPPINIPIPPNEQPSPALPGPSMDPLPADNVEIYPAGPVMTWEDLIIEARESRILGDNLIENGDPKPADGYQAHHIIPSRDPRGAFLLELLNNAGIDPSSSDNGVWLPGNRSVPGNGETPHNETMRNSYYRYLNEEFEGTDGSIADIEKRLAEIKLDLKSGIQKFLLDNGKP